MAVRPIDANAMLNELKPVGFEAEHSAVLLSDVSKMMREWVERQPTLTPPNEWVSVEERLPNDKQIVLFRQKNGFIYCAEYFAGNSLCSPSWFIDCDCWEAKEVTHWMPLPAPPDRRPPEGEGNA